MQPLVLIRPIYCEMSSRQKWKHLKRRCSLVVVALLIKRVKVIVIALYTLWDDVEQHSWTTMIEQRMPFSHPPLLLSVCRTQSHLAVWWRQAGFEERRRKREEGGGETFWLPSHNCQPYINTWQLWQSVVYRTSEHFFSGWWCWKSINQPYHTRCLYIFCERDQNRWCIIKSISAYMDGWMVFSNCFTTTVLTNTYILKNLGDI